MTTRYTDMQLDALRELANIASGTAATALSRCWGARSSLNVPRALALPLADAVEAAGSPGDTVSGVVIPVDGDLEALVLLLFPLEHAATLCRLLGVEPGTEVGDSALSEIGNILGTSYLNALASMTGLALEPCPPQLTTDLLGAIVASLLAATAGETDIALVLDSELDVADEPCSMSFLLLPTPAASPTCWRRSASAETAALTMVPVRDGRDGCVRGCRRGARRDRPGLVHRAGAGRPLGLRRRAGAHRAARVARSRRATGKFADLAVPELIEQLLAAGARRNRLEAAIARRRAHVRARRRSLDIGARNDAAVRAALAAARLPLHAIGHRRQPRPDGARRRRDVHGHRAGRPAGGRHAARAPGIGHASRHRGGRRAPVTEILSPEEVAALVEAAKQGQLPERRRAPAPGAASACARSTSRGRRSSPTTISAGSRGRMDTFCQTAATRLSAELRAPIELEVDQHRPADLVGGAVAAPGRLAGREPRRRADRHEHAAQRGAELRADDARVPARRLTRRARRATAG